MERKNMIVGSVWVCLFMLLGFILEMKLGSGEAWEESTMRHLWKTAHLHGVAFGLLNLLYGLVIGRMGLGGRSVSVGSILAVVGAIVFPISLFLGGISFKIVYVAPLGGISMIAAWAIMAYAVIIRKPE